MDQSRSVIKESNGRSGQYDSGLQSLVRSLQWAFGFLLLVIIGMLIYFFTAGGYFTVEPQNEIIVYRFGKYENTYSSGGHWFMPYPVNRWVRIMTNQQSLRVRFVPVETVAGLQVGSLEPGRDTYLFTGDANIIHCEWALTYHISNSKRYYESLSTPPDPSVNDMAEIDENGFVGGRGPQTLLRNLFREAATSVTASLKVDDIFGARQGSYSDAVQREFTRLVAEADFGIEADNVTLERLYPPLKTKAAFDEVAAASNTSASLVNQALQYEVAVRSDMLTQEAEMLASARTYKTMVVAEMKAESTYFSTINEEYKKSPKTVLMALYNEALAEVLGAQHGKFLLGTGNSPASQKKLWLKLNPIPKRQNVADPSNATAGKEAR